MPGWAVAAATVYAGSQGASAAQGGAEAQAAASRYAADINKAMFDKQNAQQTGYRAAGQNALAQIGALGSGTYQIYDEAGNPIGEPKTGTGYLTQRFTPEEFAKGMDPSYKFRLQQGEEATRRQANLAGGQIGGNTLKSLQDYSQGLASTEYANAYNRFQTERGNIYNTLASIAGLGQTSLGQTGSQSVLAGQNIGNATANAGSAAGAAQVAKANIYGGTAQSLANQYYYNSLRNNTGNQNYTDAGGWSGGGNNTVNVPGEGTMSVNQYFSPA